MLGALAEALQELVRDRLVGGEDDGDLGLEVEGACTEIVAVPVDGDAARALHGREAKADFVLLLLIADEEGGLPRRDASHLVGSGAGVT